MYISSAAVKHNRIADAVKELASHGFKQIELSGGTRYYAGFEADLLELKQEHGLSYLLHNYFPPPAEDFILNLASLDPVIFAKTLNHYQGALELSKRLGAGKFGLHAGFLIDFSTREIGQDIARHPLHDASKAMDQFCKGFNQLKALAGGIELYIENNVLSLSNQKTYAPHNPFMLTDYEGYLDLKQRLDFKLLLDVAHLYVSAVSLNLDYRQQLKELLPLADYVHISDNDGKSDSNRCFCQESDILSSLKGYNLNFKIITSESYGNPPAIKASAQLVAQSLGID